MTRSRIALFSPGLVLLGVLTVVGAAIYLHHNLPELLRLQAERTLRQYGVDTFAYAGQRFSATRASVDSLSLSGTHGNLAWQARVTNGVLHYNWRTLLIGEAESLSLSSLELTVVQTAAQDKQDTATLIVEEFLPARLLAQLPFQSLQIDQWHVNYRSPGNWTTQAHGSLIMDEQIDLRLGTTLGTCAVAGHLTADSHSPDLQLQLSMTEKETGVAVLAAQLARGTDEGWEWRLQGQAKHAPLLSCLRAFETRNGLALGIPRNQELSLHGESEFTAHIAHPDSLNLVAAPDADDAPLRQLQGSIQLTNRILSLDISTLVEQLHGTVTLDATLGNARIDAVVQPLQLTSNLATQRLSLPRHWQSAIGWRETVALKMETAEPITLASGENGSWSVHVRGAELSLGDDNTQLRLQKLNLDALTSGTDPLPASVQLDASLAARLDQQALPQLQVAFTHSGSSEHSEVTLRIADVTESFRADLTGSLNPKFGNGTYAVVGRIDDLPNFASTATPLLRHFKLLERDVVLHAGSIRLTTALTSSGFDLDNWSQRSRLSAQNISGNFDDYAFDNLNLTADWSGITRWKTLQPLQISVAVFDSGIAVRDILLHVSLPESTPITQPRVRIDDFSATLFGGELALADAPLWDFAAASNSATLTASGWQLGELVALQKKADIDAEGTLEGALPITLSGGRMSIENGYLRALPPGGHIRYRANENTVAMANTNPELALALDLLSDFQYQHLNSEVQLDTAGDLLLALSLEGNNPALHEGQAIRFNINVEQNLDPLLQSLRIGDNLEQRIEGGLR